MATSAPAPTTAPAEQSVKPITTPIVQDSLNAVRVNMQDSTVLTADRIGKIRDNDESLELLMPNDVTWSIDLASIENIEELNIDMGVTIGKADIPETVLETALESVNTDEEYVLMSLAYDGPFEFDATISIPIESGHEGKVANLYYYNPSTEELEFIGAANIDKDGTAKFNMKHASDYVILFADSSLEEVIAQPTEEETSEEAVTETASNETQEEDSFWNIILVISVVVLIVVCLAVATILIKLRHKKDEDDEDDEDVVEDESLDEEDYYLDEEDDEK